ncbi:MAG TPA: hypothetical protein VFU02_16185, partial [Polyangiaceae bacterium]|nr:hypothetical protein [Polyangiaceae bacterium]
VLGDPTFELYRAYGIERSVAGLLHPRALGSALAGLVRAPSNFFANSGGITGLPAEFLIAEDGLVIHAHYGRHADDHLDVDEVLERFGR